MKVLHDLGVIHSTEAKKTIDSNNNRSEDNNNSHIPLREVCLR